MKVTFNWLKTFLKINCSFNDLANILSGIGLEVDNLIDYNIALGNFVICEILDFQKHEQADQLSVCQVFDGKETLQIVCGAQNLSKGMKAVLAPIGTVIPNNDMTIKKTKIRGIESFGMLCAREEIFADDQNNDEGIIDLRSDQAKVGSSYAEFLGMNDIMFDINITPNRGDCLSAHGIARDLYAYGGFQLKKEKFFALDEQPVYVIKESDVIVGEAKSLCHEIIFININGINNQKGVDDKLLTSVFNCLSLKHNSKIVDISNLLILEFGRPNHIYDADKIKGKVAVRLSIAGEGFISLENKEYELPAGLLVVADEEKVLSIAGVIGGELSKVDENTTNVLVEIGDFDEIHVAKSSQALNIKTESSYRFERRIDWSNSFGFANYMVKQLLEKAGGEVKSASCARGEKRNFVKEITFDFAAAKDLIGAPFDEKLASDILLRLGFELKGNICKVPIWRQGDVNDAAAVAEELVRMIGLENLTSAMKFTCDAGSLIAIQPDKVQLLRTRLVHRGFYELINWSFTSQDYNKVFNSGATISLSNPITNDLSVMRSHLLPNLLKAIAKNLARFVDSLSFFEFGKVFHKDDVGVRESYSLVAVRSGLARRKSVHSNERSFDFFDVKDDLLSLFDELKINVNNLTYTDNKSGYYHRGKSASIFLGKNHLADVGELHPNVLRKFAIKKPVIAFEMIVHNLPKKDLEEKTTLTVMDRQKVKRDFAFIFAKSVKADEIVKVIRSLRLESIVNIDIFDIYESKEIGEGLKSVALNIELQPKERNLNDEDIKFIANKVIDVLTTKLNGRLRSR